MPQNTSVFFELGSALSGQWVAPIPLAPQASHTLGAAAGTASLSVPPADSPAARQRAEEHHRAGMQAYAVGQLEEALKHFLEALALRPNVATYQFSAGVTWWQKGQYEAGQQCLERALTLDPSFARAHQALAQLHSQKGRLEQAIDHARAAAALLPHDTAVAITLADTLEIDRQTQAAWEIVQTQLRAGQITSHLVLVFARLATQRGQTEDALALINRALNRTPQVSGRERSSLGFAAAALHDKLGRYDEAFRQVRQANALRGARYDAARMEREVDGLITSFTRRRLRSFPRSTRDSRKALFIVGIPRSGTSLVEQILASHPSVHGGGELNWILRLSADAARRSSGFAGGTAFLDSMSLIDIDELAARYLDPLTQLAPKALRITDKMPSNFMYLGLIALLCPEAQVIHVQRNPLDTCLSCFFTDFASGNEFAYDLKDLSHFYGQYRRLMSHWKAVLELPIFDVSYEKLVSSTEEEVRRMLEFAKLPWDDHCLRFHENPRFVPTASHQQVRQPIYQTSVERWRHYEKHLGPLMGALGWG